MAGFTLYETLRIFLPGLFVVTLTNIAVRLATGKGVLEAGDGAPRAIAEALSDPAVAAVVAVVVGLVLYVLNFPDRRRIYYHGDPASGKGLPSGLLDQWVAADGVSDARIGGKSAFFILQDELMPDKFHQRVYLFGSLYKVIVWLRVLLTFAVYVGCFASLIHAMQSTDVGMHPDFVAALWVLLTPAAMLIQGRTAQHHSRVLQARRSGGSASDGSGTEVGADPEAESAARPEADGNGRPARRRLSFMLLLSPVAPTMIALAAHSGEGRASIGLVLLLAAWPASALLLWLALEVGPPAADRDGRIAGRDDDYEPDANTVSLREHLLLCVGERSDAASRYGPPDRTWFDAALFLPAIVAASAAAALLGRASSSVIVWSALALAATTLGASPKHEDRLLNSFKDQRAWLALNERGIRAFLKGEIAVDKIKTFEPG